MRVLMFGWEFPPHISGGLGTACYGLTRGLLQNDVEVVFVVPKVFGDEAAGALRLINASNIPLPRNAAHSEFLSSKFTFYGLNSLLVPYLDNEQFAQYSNEISNTTAINRDSTFHSKYEFSGKYGKNLMDEVWHYALVAGQITQHQNFDVIHAHDWLSFPAGILAKESSGKPLIAHVHATEFDRSGEHVNQLVYGIERRGMECADKVVAVSEFTRQIILNRYGIPPEKVEVVHNAIEKDETAEVRDLHSFDEKVVTYLGRITFQKGPEYFIDAAAKVLAHDKNFRFVMAGSGDMLNRMIRKAAAMRISSHFHFTGFLKGKDVDRVFAMSNVYVMPSVSEPFGISPLEALQSNVPVIISRQSGVKEVLKHAIKIDFWDTDAMANAMYALARFNGLSRMFVREGKKEMEHLTWNEQARKIKDIYHQHLN
jgi:glycosyltransferase involved in cell wall biosynthesis